MLRTELMHVLVRMARFAERGKMLEPKVLLRNGGGVLEFVTHRHHVWFSYRTDIICSWRRPVYVDLLPFQDAIAGYGWINSHIMQEPIQLTKAGNGDLQVDVEGYSLTLPNLGGNAFPELPYEGECGWGPSVDLDAPQWQVGMRFLEKAICRDPDRPNLCALCITPSEMVASDGCRLHILELFQDFAEALGARDQVLVPPETARFFGHLPSDCMVQLAFGSQFVRVRVGSWTLHGGIIQGRTYPEWRKVLPNEGFELSVEAGSWGQVLKVFAHDSRPLEMSRREEGLVLTQGLETGRRTGIFPVKDGGRGYWPGVFAFNAQYLLEALPGWGGRVVTFSGDGVERPVIIRESDSRAWAVVMPMRR